MSGDFTFLKGNIETIILCSLVANDKYGWEISKEITDKTANKYVIKQPTLYAYLKRLEAQKLIQSYWGSESNGGRRRYYRLTQSGREQCEQFASEWKYQQDVLNNLIDKDETESIVDEVKQEDVTPLFGSKVKKRIKEIRSSEELEEIEKKLNSLSDESAPVAKEAEQVQVEPIPVVIEQEKPAVTPSKSDVDTRDYPQHTTQQNPESFMLDFEQKIREIESSSSVEDDKADDYQDVLMSVLGEQLDNASNYTEPKRDTSVKTQEQNKVALEDMAEQLAMDGIRMRIYNRATSTYTPQVLVCRSKVLCVTAWLMYVFDFFAFLLMSSVTASMMDSTVYLAIMGVLALIPLGLSVYYLMKPIRSPKPNFKIKPIMLIVGLSAMTLILILCAVNFLFDLINADVFRLMTQVVIPSFVMLNAPISVILYGFMLNHYSK